MPRMAQLTDLVQLCCVSRNLLYQSFDDIAQINKKPGVLPPVDVFAIKGSAKRCSVRTTWTSRGPRSGSGGGQTMV